jgi:hypothetical protein
MDIGNIDEDLPVKETEKTEPQNFFQKLLSFIFQSDSPEKERKKLLKEIGKALKKQKYKFYNVKTEEALSDLAKFFHEIYKILGPTQVLLEQSDSSGVLKNIIIESYLTDTQRQQADLFNEEAIRERAKDSDPKKLAAELKESILNYFAAFDIQKVKDINATYNLLLKFLEIVRFDYYFLLKKFDANMPERDFIYNPKFEIINGEYIVDDLKDYEEVMPLIDREAPWEVLFDVLKEYKGDEIISRNGWKKVLKFIGDLKRSKVFSLMIRHIDKDPYYKYKIYPPNEKIVEEYLAKIKTQVELTLQKIAREKKASQRDQLLKAIFGTTAISRMKFYTEKTNMTFSKKMLGGFLHVSATNYLKAFLLDFYKKDVKELVDILLIRGNWTTNLMSQQLSESFHRIMNISNELIVFDNSLSEEEDLGISLNNAVKRAERDPNAMKVLRQLLKKTNDTAAKLVQEAGQHLINVGKNLKQVLDDYSKEPHEIILNYKELDVAAEGNLKNKIVEVYKKIYYFAQLLKMIQK